MRTHLGEITIENIITVLFLVSSITFFFSFILGEGPNLDLQNYKNVNPTIFSKYGNRVFFIISFIYILAILILRKVK